MGRSRIRASARSRARVRVSARAWSRPRARARAMGAFGLMLTLWIKANDLWEPGFFSRWMKCYCYHKEVQLKHSREENSGFINQHISLPNIAQFLHVPQRPRTSVRMLSPLLPLPSLCPLLLINQDPLLLWALSSQGPSLLRLPLPAGHSPRGLRSNRSSSSPCPTASSELAILPSRGAHRVPAHI